MSVKTTKAVQVVTIDDGYRRTDVDWFDATHTSIVLRQTAADGQESIVILAVADIQPALDALGVATITRAIEVEAEAAADVLPAEVVKP